MNVAREFAAVLGSAWNCCLVNGPGTQDSTLLAKLLEGAGCRKGFCGHAGWQSQPGELMKFFAQS